MPVSPISTIIFDFGNVIGFFDHQITWNKVAPHTDLSLADYLTAIRKANLEDDYESGRLSSAQFIETLCSLGRLRCKPHHVRAAWKDIFSENTDIFDLIRSLKCRKYRLQLGSNTNELHAEQFLEQFKTVLDLFDALTLSHEIGARKPRLEFYADCHKKAACPVEQCVFIDDLPANIAGARAYGFQGLLFTDVRTLHKQLLKLGVEW